MKIDVDKLLGGAGFYYQTFDQKAKNKKLRVVDRGYGARRSTKVEFKRYPRLNKVVLPDAFVPRGTTLADSLARRRSDRDFSKKTVTLKKLSDLLHFSAGLNPDRRGGLRFYPSGGSKYPLEVYLISLNTELVDGLYHYSVVDHLLEELLTFKKFDAGLYFHQVWIKKSAFVILFTAVFDRVIPFYGERGYKNILLETGHLAQNFYLNSSAMGLGCCAIGGYVDDKINRLLDINGVDESIVYSMVLGEKADRK